MTGFWIAAAILTALVVWAITLPLGAGAKTPGNRTALLAVMGGLPLAALGLYLIYGHPELPGQPLHTRDQTAVEAHRELHEAAGELARQLELEPDNINGWALLGRLWQQLDRPGDAARAFARAAELDNGNPALALAQAEAQIRANDGIVSPATLSLLRQIHGREPDIAGPHFYFGLSRWQAGDAEGAIVHWVRTYALTAPETPGRRRVEGHLFEAGESLGITEALMRQRLAEIAETPQRMPETDMQDGPG